MERKAKTSSKLGIETRDEHELLEQEDFGWLADMRDILSPYWSSRLEYHPEKKARVLALQGTRSTNG